MGSRQAGFLNLSASALTAGQRQDHVDDGALRWDRAACRSAAEVLGGHIGFDPMFAGHAVAMPVLELGLWQEGHISVLAAPSLSQYYYIQ